MNFEKYIGIPYAEKGRDENGTDCWGLVRLVYKNELNIDLPSFTADYDTTDGERLEELFAQYKEGWESTDNPEVGDAVIFRIFGYESHIGICIGDNKFLHVREGRDAVIESLDNAKWSKRITGFFRYSEKKNAVLNTVPHPLRTERYTLGVAPGTTVTELVKDISTKYNIAIELKSRISILINGKVIAQENWNNTVVKQTDVIEYRAVPSGSALRTLALIALVIVVPQLAGMAEFAYMGTAGATIAGSAAVYTATYAAAMLVGSALINAIAPIRPPQMGSQNDPGSAERQLMVNGGSNRLNAYGAIPVVLGKVRVTPLLGSTNFLTYENERDSYLSMLLVWGYGPLSIDDNSYKIGDVPISSFTDVVRINDDRIADLSAARKRDFDSIYGKDVTQVNTAVELVCDGNPEGTISGYSQEAIYEYDWELGASVIIGYEQVPIYQYVAPGPWFEAITTDPTTSVTLALHFPQGLRYVQIQGDNAGNSYPTTVVFRAEFSTDNGVSFPNHATFSIGGDTAKKDAFTYTKTFHTNSQNLLVRIRRETGDNVEDNSERRYYFTSVLQNVTFLNDNQTPAVDPVGAKIAKTAFKIKATDQLNGSIQGINAIVQTYCKIWNGTAWVDGVTSNPAALMRYVLEHPANPKRITDASTQINLTQLQYFYNYCQTKGFEYNGVLGEARSILEVIRDICAAGRASPALIDGKWSVVIDEAKPNVVQHFTPHNSWNFEGSKALPKRPDGLRVTYYNQDYDYQESEIIIYDVDKNKDNASLFESITLPGVTKTSLVIDHAKWHMAQMKLRPELYTLESDIEYLVCNRGDRVKVMHDVPMWGLGSGRIKNRISSTQFELDENLPMKAGIQYTMRIRSKTGTSTTRTLVAKPTDGYYSTIDFTTSALQSEVDALDLFLFGELNQESQDLIVLSIEPTNNNNARITLVDYGVTSTYNIFTDYLSLSASTVFESQITLPPVLQVQAFGDKVPFITGFVSDESVMERISRGVFKYNINVAYFNASQLPSNVEYVEVQYDLLSSTTGVNYKSIFVPYQNGSANIGDVKEGEVYKVRMRYVSRDGKLGNWSAYSNHTVVGKTNPPSQVTGFTITAEKLTGKLLLSWNENPEIDTKNYEVRSENANWGTGGANLIFSGSATNCTTNAPSLNTTKTFYIKALDFGNLYSVQASSASYTTLAPATYTGTITSSYADTSTTDSTVTLKWTAAPAGVFDINKYEVTITKPSATVVQEISGLTWTTLANWVGNATVTIKSIDILGNKSVAASTGVVIAKSRPTAPASVTFTVADAQVYVDWADVTKTTLPVGGYEIRKNNTGWGTNDANFVWRGSVSNATLKGLIAGTNNWYINTFDTDNVYASSGTLITYTVQRPAIATSLTATFSDTSTTSAVVKFDWIAPAVTTFGIKKYNAVLTKPGGGSVTASLDSTTWTVAADWTGNATLTITTFDMLDFSSATNASLIVTKSAPNNVGAVTFTPSVNEMVVKWTPIAKTTLPIAGYEIRANDTGWGTSTGLTWRGATNTTSIGSLSTGSNVFYIKAFDTEGVYSTLATSFDLVVNAPLASNSLVTTYANTSTSGTTVTFKWTGNKGTFDISSYNITLTKPGSIVITANVSANTFTTAADWLGDATLAIVALDTSNNAGATFSSTIGKTRPVAPTTVTTTPSPTGLTIAWNEGVKGSLPIAGYELRTTGSSPGGTDYIWKGTASSVTISNLVLGANTWDLWAFDTDLRYSLVARAVSYTTVRPSNPQTLSGAFNTSLTNSLAEFKWVKPSTSVFGIARYEVSLTTTNPVRTINSTRLTTDWAVPADWLGDATLSVTAYDNLGFASLAQTFVLSKVVPNQPGAFLTPGIKGTSLSLDWPDNIKTSLPIVGYELRSSDANWGGTGFIWKGSASNTSVDMVGVTSGTTSSWYLRAYDSDNRYSSSSRLFQYTVAAPVNTASITYQFVDTSLTSATVSLRWLDTSPTFGLKHYEITGALSVPTTTTANSNLLTLTSTKGILVNDVLSGNANIPAGRRVTQIISATQLYIDNATGVLAGTAVGTVYNNINYSNSTSVTQDADWLGNKTYTVKTVDLIGNKSTGTSISVTKELPHAASNLKAQVIDNTVLLYWDLPQITSLPISHVLIKKGATWNTANIIGTKSGTFTTITELQGGLYTYWVAVVDTDNNESIPISLAATVSQPPDYIFNAEYISTFTGTKSNAIIEPNTGYLVLPVDTVESFSGHFTTRSWNTPTDQINAGFPVYIQPGTSSGYYEEVFDYGTTLGSSQITVSLSGVNIAGSPNISVTISSSLNGSTYTSFPAGTSAFATNFRYIKVRVSATQVTSGNIYSISGLVVRLDAKQKTDSGSSVLTIGGAHAQGSVIADYYTWTAGMTMPPSGYTLYGTAAESAIITAVGPSASNENIWACIDTDIAADADGGFYSTYSDVDSTKGYMFAVFVKTTTNNGITYFGTSTNSSILNLAGTVNTNPYFFSGDLPALNTWYLLVGYVYPSSYGTVDGGISGIYNMSGTKVVSATSFKFAAGALQAIQRTFHNANPTGTGTQVQFMARPVVIQCDAADAASKISYLLKCTNDYGATVVPNINYVDVTSITTTPNSVNPTTTVVDFFDKPYPTRFNIFNYNSVGANVGGTISWTVRGY